MKKIILILLLSLGFTAQAQRTITLRANCAEVIDTTPAVLPYDSAVWSYENTLADSGCILTPIQRATLVTLVQDLKDMPNPRYTTGVNFWARDIAYYPIVGSCAFAYSLNLKDPRNENSAFRLSKTVSAGSLQYSDSALNIAGTMLNSHINPTVHLSPANFHVSYYSRESSSDVTTIAWGAYDNTVGDKIIQMNLGNGFYAGTLSPSAAIPFTTTRAFFIGQRSGTTVKAFRNGMVTGSGNNSGALPNLEMGFMSRNTNGTFALGEPRRCSFASAGAAMTDAEAVIFTRIVNEYQKRLGRAVF